MKLESLSIWPPADGKSEVSSSEASQEKQRSPTLLKDLGVVLKCKNLRKSGERSHLVLENSWRRRKLYPTGTKGGV